MTDADRRFWELDRAWRELTKWAALAAFGAGMFVGTVLMWWWS